MRSIQLNIRVTPGQLYDIKKLAEYFNTTPSTIIRNSIDDYIYIFRKWQGRLCNYGDPIAAECSIDYETK